jgi:hypothetical protein
MRGKLWRAAALTTVAVLAGAFASTASADETFPAGKVCPFPVQLETVVDNENAPVVFPEANGDVRVIVTGRYVARLTNLENGNSLVVNASGPAFLTIHPDGSFDGVFAGRSLIDLFPSDIPAGPVLLVNSGRLIIETVLGGEHIGGLQTNLQAQVGHLEDLCTVLA